MRGRRLDGEQAGERGDSSPPRAAEEHAVLALQRNAGNAAVSRLLQRDTPTDAPAKEGWSFNPVRPGSQLGMRPEGTIYDLRAGPQTEHAAAVEAVVHWFGPAAADITSGRSKGFVQSIAELVKSAREVSFKAEGKTGKVADHMSAAEVESLLRDEAKRKGVRLLDHRALTDKAGARSEAMAILENLGRIPTEVQFGGEGAKLVVSIAGKVTGELAVGKGKLEAEGSAEGAEATYTLPGGKTKIQGRGGPEGGGGSIMFEGGKVSVDITDKKVQGEVKAGDMLTVKGSAGTNKEGVFAWRADIQIGTLGKVATVEEIAKLMIGAEDTFGKAAGDLSKGLSVEKAKEHGSAVKDAVKDVVEKAEKSAKQAKKGGWGAGVSVQGDERGGWSAGVTLTWIW